MKRNLFIFILKVIVLTVAIFVTLRLYGWYVNKPVVEFVNLLFYISIILLIIGLIMVLIKFFREGKGESKSPSILSTSTLLISVAITLLVISSILTMIICNLTR